MAGIKITDNQNSQLDGAESANGSAQASNDNTLDIPDVEEMDRQHIQHYALRAAIQSNFAAPLDMSNVHTILDVECGPGTWVMEMATDYPNVMVHGVHHQAVFPSSCMPRNADFRLHPFKTKLPFDDNTFDYVHQRMVGIHVPSDTWRELFQDLVRVTKPGGWIELVELNPATFNPGERTRHWDTEIHNAVKAKGVDPTLHQKLKDILLEHVGDQVTDAEFREVDVNVGEWSGKVGGLMKEQYNLSIRVLQRLTGAVITEQDREEIMQELEQNHSFRRYYIAYARKAQ